MNKENKENIQTNNTSVSTPAYKQALTPNWSGIGEIIIAAKGADRTMAEFSEVCGIHASTLSRLMNGKLKRPLSFDAIDAIMDNKCAACSYTKADLIRANGMVDAKTYEQRYQGEHSYNNVHNQNERLGSMRTVLINELFARGIPFKKAVISKTDEDSALRDVSLMRSGILLELPASEYETYWAMMLNTTVWEHGDPGPGSTIPGKPSMWDGWFKVRMMSYYSSLFLKDAWEPETMEDIKCSFVFCDKYIYDAFRRALQKARISSNMTTILVSLEEGKVLKEEPVPGCRKPDQQRYFEIAVDEMDNLFITEEDLIDDPLFDPPQDM